MTVRELITHLMRCDPNKSVNIEVPNDDGLAMTEIERVTYYSWGVSILTAHVDLRSMCDG